MKKIVEINNKDKKILYHLLKDSRQSLRILGKRVGISRELASYRIKKLCQKKIITNFIVNISTGRLGYISLNNYYKFKNINPDIKNNIINYFINHNLTTYVSSIEGIYDFQVESILGEVNYYETYVDEIKKKFHKYLSLEHTETWIGGEYFDYPFLIDENENKLKSHKWRWGANLVQIDQLDFKILSELSIDSRKTTIDIANKLDSTVSIINNRVKKLMENKIIDNFTINVDWSKIGYRWFHLRINLNDYDKKNQIVEYAKKNPHLVRMLKGLIHNVDIHCTYLLKNVEQLRSITENISSEYPNAISNYQFYSSYMLYKHRYMIPKVLNVQNTYYKRFSY